jgi:hypothetical protein
MSGRPRPRSVHFENLEWAYAQRALSAPQRAVLVALAHHCHKDASCWPSMERLAHMTAFDRATVHRALRSLRAAKLIDIEKRRSRSGRQAASRYTLSRDDVESPEMQSATLEQPTPDARSVTLERPPEMHSAALEPSAPVQSCTESAPGSHPATSRVALCDPYEVTKEVTRSKSTPLPPNGGSAHAFSPNDQQVSAQRATLAAGERVPLDIEAVASRLDMQKLPPRTLRGFQRFADVVSTRTGH